MFTGLEHIALEVGDVAGAASDYSAVLGRRAELGTTSGKPTARLQLANLGLVLVAGDPAGACTGEARLRLVLAAPDFDKAAHRLERRGLPVRSQPDRQLADIDTAATHGVAISVAAVGHVTPTDAAADADIAGLDHVVVRTPDPERAVALYGGRLGLDLRLDRTSAERGNRMLFFVAGDLVVEIVHDARKGVGAGRDRIFGLAWRANDIERAHARLVTGGVEVSEIREGRRPGTRVFTVKGRTAGVPTLVIGGDGLVRS
jgi:catechol 2,3-dioxygenase-like lactoylglutathione lyase family enzyme